MMTFRSLYYSIAYIGQDIFEKIQSPQELCDIISQFYDFENVKFITVGSRIIKSFFQQNIKWQSSMLSLLLNYTTIKLAELESLKETLEAENLQLRQLANSLKGHTISLSILLKYLDYNLHSIPYDIANSMFEIAKSLQKSFYQQSQLAHLQSQQENHAVSSDLLYINSIRQETSWLIVNSLLTLEQSWLNSKMKEIL